MSIGPLTVERHAVLKSQGVDFHVFVRGEDVTRRCHYVDDTPGRKVAFLYRHNDNEHVYLDEDGTPSMEIAEGDDVEIRPVQAEPNVNLELIRAQLYSARATIDAVLFQLDQPAAAPAKPLGSCPHCGAPEDKQVDASTLGSGPLKQCLVCRQEYQA